MQLMRIIASTAVAATATATATMVVLAAAEEEVMGEREITSIRITTDQHQNPLI
jgi:hypothetical protein